MLPVGQIPPGACSTPETVSRRSKPYLLALRGFMSVCGLTSHPWRVIDEVTLLCNSTQHAQGGSSIDTARIVTLSVDTIQRTALPGCFKPVQPQYAPLSLGAEVIECSQFNGT